LENLYTGSLDGPRIKWKSSWSCIFVKSVLHFTRRMTLTRYGGTLSTLGKLKQGDHKFCVSVGDIVTPSLKEKREK
jgi:hypothetical protein